MAGRNFLTAVAAVLASAIGAAPALAQDAELCFSTADLVKEGTVVPELDKKAAHEACQRALAMTSSITQKYQLQEADFDVTGTAPSPDCSPGQRTRLQVFRLAISRAGGAYAGPLSLLFLDCTPCATTYNNPQHAACCDHPMHPNWLH